MNSLLLLIMSANINYHCNRCITYYVYYTCQLGSYVIETDRRDIVHALGGSRTYSGPRPRRLALN